MARFGLEFCRTVVHVVERDRESTRVNKSCSTNLCTLGINSHRNFEHVQVDGSARDSVKLHESESSI